MSIPVINPNTAAFAWTDPTSNTDGSPLQAGEVTGYTIGIRPASGTAGTYPITANVPGADAVKEAVSAIGTMLQPGDYAAAIQSAGPVPSAWSSEIQFEIAQPQPNPPTDFTVA